MAEDDDNDSGEKTKKASNKKPLKILLVVVILMAVSIGGTLLVIKLLSGGDGENEKEMVEGEPGKNKGAAEEKPPAIYFPLKPAIIVNFQSKGKQRFLQAELTLMAREDDVIQAIEQHMPMIRNSLVLLFGGQVYEDLQTDEGKELLLQAALLELQKILEREIGKKGIEQILFTNFVMQ